MSWSVFTSPGNRPASRQRIPGRGRRGFSQAVAAATAFALACQAAKAQDYQALVLARDAERAASEDAARRADVALVNERSRELAQAQGERAIRDLTAPGGLSVVVVAATLPTHPLALVSIPESVLADSNAKVRAAADNRR